MRIQRLRNYQNYLRLLTAIVVVLCGSTQSASAATSTGAAVDPTPTGEEFTFIVLGDSQFHQPVAYNRLINDVARLQPAFTVQVGDMIQGYASGEQVANEWQRFQTQIAPLLKPKGPTFVPVPGNHDVYGPTKKTNAEVLSIYTKLWGPTYRAFNYRDSLFVVLNTDELRRENQISGKQ